ncbi:MAG: ChaN family lipoprotein [Planctomycetes bacterium]|nr:ChaN family lipoprotein [Planctomycetota bacterium]
MPDLPQMPGAARWRSFFPLLMLPFLGVLGCQTSTQSGSGGSEMDSSEVAWAAPDFEYSISARNGHDGSRLTWTELADELAKAEAVFLGETHIDENTHRLELAVYEELLKRRPGKVTLAMEMFQRDAQGILNDYLAGEIDEPAFLAAANPWGNYASAYRPMIERAKASGGAVIASNFPNSLRQRVASDGAEFFADPSDPASRLTPTALQANTPAYWRRVDNAIRGHIGMMGGPATEESRLVSTQSLWDNSMGEACAQVLEENPEQLVLHVNGGFHSQYWDGTVRQMLLRRPETKVKTIAIVPTDNPALATMDGAPVADFVVFVHSLATDINEGTHSVFVQRELKYRLHMPKNIPAGEKVPLLIWLVDRGLNAEDGIDLWRGRLGDSAAIVSIEPPYQAIQDDLSIGGRWYWPEGFSSDTGFMQSGIHRLWGYLCRHFPVDPNRVCLAGEGTGATVVSVVTLFESDMAIQGRAFSPRQYSKIKDLPLPLPEYRQQGVGQNKNLQVFARQEDQDWWKQELNAYTEINLDNQLHLPSGDDWTAEIEQENQLRAALGLKDRSFKLPITRRHIILEVDSQRGRHWARLMAAKYATDFDSLVAIFDSAPNSAPSEFIQTQITAANLSTSHALPACPGPFGGTTVLVLPADIDSAERQAWLDLEADDPLNKRSRFLRLRIADSSDAKNLPAVLSKLASENRNNILIVPAVFCASADTMRTLRASVKSFEDRLTLHWQAGLGGRLSSN